MPTLPSALTRGSIAGASTDASDWFVVEHAGGLFRISRFELIEALGRNGYLLVVGPSGIERVVAFKTGSLHRFTLGINSTPEAGGDAGSKMFVNGCTDAGGYKFTAYEINRSPIEMKVWVPIYFPNVGTTASAANTTLDGNGNLLKSTSSEDYKTDIEPLESWRADAVIDQLEPIWYRSTAPADNADWSWYGFTAEQMAAIDPRLVHYSYRPSDYDETPVYEGEGNQRRQTGVDRKLKPDAVMVPDGVAYERLTVMLLDVVRREKAKTAALETALAALTARVEALETQTP